MGVPDGRSQLAEAMKQLKRQWSGTRCSWTDAVSQDFEEMHLDPLETDARAAMAAMDRMAALLSRLRDECA